MLLERYLATCYPQYKELVGALKEVPLALRSLLIKTCQAQCHLEREDDVPLSRLLVAQQPVVYQSKYGIREVPAIDFLKDFEPDIDNPLTSAILLDIIRTAPLADVETTLAKQKGWATEIRLAETPGRPTLNFDSFFFPSISEPIHADLPHNPTHFPAIRYRFQRYRQHLIEKTRIFYPRATQKNMSRSTRRDFEKTFGSDISSFPIFGQEDWIRIYHEFGIKLGGVVEMRQRWPPSVAKPRTYFAMGGIAYESCRHLQDFFTELVDLFPATNHITRLRPSRLRLSLDSEGHYLIYDLSSFTSNMVEMRSFCRSLASFFAGVTVVIVDEHLGPYQADLGEMLERYYDLCVNHPELSYERSTFEDEAKLTERDHARASMLGIFGNLMLCTVAHYLILSPTVKSDELINIAGDDGLVFRDMLNQFFVGRAISFIGDCAEDKTMMTGDRGSVCLKRPIFEDPPCLVLLGNVIPPGVAMTASYLEGRSIDPRYEIIGLEDMALNDRISVIGKDLLRFLESAFGNGISMEDTLEVYRGFRKLVTKILGYFPRTGPLGSIGYVWPFSPDSYDFYSTSPTTFFAYNCCENLSFHRRELEPIDWPTLRYAGDSVEGNSDKRLVLLEKLGYLEKEPLVENLFGIGSVNRWLSMQKSGSYLPVLYKYRCLKDVPDVFLYFESEL